MFQSVNLVLVTLLMSMGITLAETGEVRDPMVFFFQDSFNDLQEEGEAARDQGLVGVLVMFETDFCPFCTRMKETVLNQKQVQDYYRAHFRILNLKAEGDGMVVGFDGAAHTETEFALKHNRIRATPTFLFFSYDGTVITRYTGSTRNLQEFIWLGEYVVEGHYAEETFSLYKRRRRQYSSS